MQERWTVVRPTWLCHLMRERIISSSLRSLGVRLGLLSHLELWLIPPGGHSDLCVLRTSYVHLLGGVDGFDDFGDFRAKTKSITFQELRTT